MRLHADTPARKSPQEYLRKVKRGKPKTTWMQTVRQDLVKIRIKLDLSKDAQSLNRLSELTQDRKKWRGIVRRVAQYYLRVTFWNKKNKNYKVTKWCLGYQII